MKVSKIFGFVLSLHLGVITVLIVQPGCSTTQPPTQTYQQERTTHTTRTTHVTHGTSRVAGAARTNGDLITATRSDEGTTLDAAFNAGIESNEFAEFDDVTPLEPIQPTVDTPTVAVSGPSFETYTVKKGDSLWAISKRYSVSLNELYAANGLNKNSVLKIGQQVQIPTEGGSATVSTVTADTYQPTSYNTASSNYIVKPGDNLSKIAKQYGTTVRAIKAANGKTSDMIRVGEKLLIPVEGSTGGSSSNVSSTPTSTVSSFTPAPVPTGSARTHTVKSGEYPATIARKYGMTSGELLAINGITDPRSLQIGQVLQVSASGSAANVDTKTETVVAPAAATHSTSASYSAPAPIATNGPVSIRVVEADPLVEEEAAAVNFDSALDNAVEIPVIRLEQ